MKILRTMKKLFAITVLMALAMSGFAQNQQFDFSAVCESGQTLYYRITDGDAQTVILTHPYPAGGPGFEGNYYEGYIKPEGDIIIPSVVVHNGINYSVTAIDSNTFFECDITSVFIPNSVNDIVPRALVSCELLESITVDEENPVFYSESNALIRRADMALVAGCKATTIPDGIETICVSAFAGAGDGGDLIIPNSVKTIEDGAFSGCGFSGSLTLSDSLETIGQNAFDLSRFSGSLTIPNSITEIGFHAFFSCRFYGSLTLSSSLSIINKGAFSNCHFSGILTIPNSVTQIENFAFNGNNFSGIVLGDSVATIGHAAFLDCNNTTGVLRLPHSLTEIGTLAFKNTSFTEIYSPNRIPPTLASNAFQGYDASTPIHIPFGCTNAYQNAEGWNYFSNFIETEMNIEGEWYYEIENENGTITYQHLQCVGDTLFEGGKRPKIIIRSNTQYDKDLITETTHEYVYEENGKVYWWNKHLGKFTVLYDFSAEVGDEWTIEVGEGTIVTHIYNSEIQYINGIPYKKLTIADQDNVFSGNLLSTIGHMTSFFPERLMTRGKGYRVEGLRCYWVEDELVFQQGNKSCDAIYVELHNDVGEDGPSTGSGTLTVYPNPVNGILFVETRRATSLQGQPEYRITNLMGQTLLQGGISADCQQINIESLPAGMYFITVGETTRKFVVKY